MYGLVLKYFIIDTYLNLFFNEIEKKFSKSLTNLKPKIGDTFYKISHKLQHEVYYNCTVIDVEKIYGVDDGYMVYVKFKSKEIKKDDDSNDDSKKSVTIEIDENILNRDSENDLYDYYFNEDDFVEVEDDFLDLDDDDFDDLLYQITSEVQSIETEDKYVIGLSTLYYDFIT